MVLPELPDLDLNADCYDLPLDDALVRIIHEYGRYGFSQSPRLHFSLASHHPRPPTLSQAPSKAAAAPIWGSLSATAAPAASPVKSTRYWI